tara:strand:+ start:340 stop:498 length:159 start_codon:yes stop_codon:yes gene_type:complete
MEHENKQLRVAISKHKKQLSINILAIIEVILNEIEIINKRINDITLMVLRLN